MTPWAVRLCPGGAASAALSPPAPGISATEDGEWLWLRGDDLDEELDLELRKLPGAVRHLVGDADTVTEIGRRLPTGELPADGALGAAGVVGGGQAPAGRPLRDAAGPGDAALDVPAPSSRRRSS